MREIPVIKTITPLTLHVSFRPVSPEINPDTNLREGFFTRVFHHRFTLSTDKPVDFTKHPIDSSYVAYRKKLFGRRARFVPTYGSPSQRRLYIQTRQAILHLQFLRPKSLVLAEFDRPITIGFAPQEIIIPR